ncbi:hypothetical protein BWD07_12155 [Neisseria canis]|nr:hypothetical protein BWD07_12155 [Neisseria canis]
MHVFFQVRTLCIIQFAPTAVFSTPNDVAFRIRHLARNADLVVVVVQNLSVGFAAVPVGRLNDLCQRFVASLFGINVSIGRFIAVFLQQAAAFP